jgi:hypothetical protein
MFQENSFVTRQAQIKCLTNATGSENLRRVIDEYCWEKFGREGDV